MVTGNDGSEHIAYYSKWVSLSGDIAGNWRRFKQRFNVYLIASGYSAKSDKVKASLFLHVIGEEALEVFNTFEFTDAGDANKLDPVIQKFEDYCSPKKNTTFERYVFFSRKQKESEPFEQWLTELKMLANSCEFETLRDSLIKDAIVLGVHDVHVKDRLLREKDLKLDRAIEVCKASETSKLQLKELDSTCLGSGAASVSRKPMSKQNVKQIADCKFCGGSHPQGKCPAYGKNCNKCKGKNHFAKVCRKSVDKSKQKPNDKASTSATTIMDPDHFYIGAVEAPGVSRWKTKVTIENHQMLVKLDTGTDISIMPKSFLQQIAPNIELKPFNLRISGVGSNSVGACVGFM